jgi:hypothetical protein
MAQLNYINMAGISKIGINLTNIVGPGAPNKTDDVAVIQALLRYIATVLGKEAIGINEGWPRPKPTGQWDLATEIAVRGYKANYADRLLTRANPDLRVHPASYKGRVIKKPWGPLMMITHLHLFGLLAASQNGDPDYVAAIRDMLPLFARISLLHRPHLLDS